MRDLSLDPLLSQARFQISAPTRAACPPESGPEIAFCGRSNAGKSSALNVLTGQKNLARVSKTPGRTQLINFFQLGETTAALVDLPGYGYAKVPEAMKREWQKHLGEFLEKRASLKGLVVLMDIRLPMTALDAQLLAFADARNLETLILLTKSDKLSHNQAAKARLAMTKVRPESTIVIFSALHKVGLQEASLWITDRIAPNP
ncbi:MAG: YihA family ribosome biogenesis GTP-binding protein [Gammaproteobacteria bacterium]|nr:YihA family ribosome biogenesis GTP-binding protein [Gammaproteobacteria bacterium]